jgi:tetratricopeptide (TPR) repeat protein
VLTAVGEDHPFVTTPAQRLAGSPHATDIKNEATAEVRRAAEHKGLGRKTVGTLAAAGSGLTVAELADLTDSTPIAIRTLLQTRLRRSIRPERANSLDGAGEGPPFVFSHATLPGFVAESLGDKIEDVYRRHIHDWATERRRQGWSSRCPHYLITGYPALLDATDDMPRLLEYALDTERHEWLAARGYDGQVLSEIRAAERLNLRREPANLLVALKLARQRMRIEDRNTNVPVGLLSTLAALGEPDRALSLAATITDNVRRAASLAAIAAAQVGAQHADDAANTLAQARTVAHAITDGSRQVTALTLIATTEITLGQPGRALDIAAAIPDDVKRVGALTAIATAQIDAGHTDDAAHTLAQALTATNAFADDVKRVDALTAIATAQMNADHQGEAATTLGKAVTAVQAITGTERQGAALALLAKAQITLGQQATGIATLDDALMRVLADTGSRSAYPPARVRVLVAIAETQIAAGQRDQAVATLERAVETSSDFHEDYDYWRRWDTVAEIGNAQAAAGLDAEARATIRLISYAPAQASALAGVAVVQAAAGRYDEARSTASLIDDPFSVGRSLSGIAEAQAHAGLLRDALTTFDGITSPEHRLSSLAEIAAAQATVGLRDEALRTAESSLIISREIPHRQHQDAAAAAIAEAQTDAGRYDRAVTAARTIGSAEHRSKTLALVAEAQMSGGLPDDAAATFDLALAAASSVSRPEGQADAYTVVGKAQARSNLRDGAAETLEKARIAADTINLVDRRTRALASIADAQVTAGLFDAATATATSIGYARQKAETFTAIASAQVRDNSYDEAETNLDNALRAADNLQFETWWAPTVRHITELYEAIGRSEKALAVPRIVLGRSVVPGASQRADTAESPEQSSAVLRRRVALALAAGPWYESVRAACRIEPAILEALT